MRNSYVVASVQPSVVWLDRSSLNRRLDATYYSATHMRLDKALSKAGLRTEALGSFLVGPRRILYMNTKTFERQSEDRSRIRFVSGVDVDEATCSIRWDKTLFVDRSMAVQYPKGLLRPKTLLIKVKGPNQLAAFVEAPPTAALVSGTFVFGQVKSINPWYLTVYITTSLAMQWRTRLRQNITVEFTPYEELAEIPVLLPSPEIQRAIGNKIRKAERLRELAKVQWTSALAELSVALGVSLTAERFEQLSPSELRRIGYYCIATRPATVLTSVSDEIGAQYFHPRRIHAQELAGKSWQQLSEVSKRVRRKGKSKRFVGLEHISSATGVIDPIPDADDRAGVTFRRGDVLFSRLRPYLNKVTIWTSEFGVGSSELLVYRPLPHIDEFYLFLVLKSLLGMYQVIDVTSGSTHPRVDEEVVDAIRIPRLQGETEVEIGERVAGALSQWYEAQQLIPRARLDVESLVDGTLVAEELVSQGEVLERWLAEHPSPDGAEAN